MINLKRTNAAKKAWKTRAGTSDMVAQKAALARGLISGNIHITNREINAEMVKKFGSMAGNSLLRETRQSLGVVKVTASPAYISKAPTEPAKPKTQPIDLAELTTRVQDADDFTALLRQLRDAMREKDIVKVIVTADGATLKREVSEYVSLK